jgi:DNA-binding CsgD family transcriptional regulator/tetratricopeptide (TPR) repeat protein
MELLNREEELAALNDLLEAAQAGRGGALVLRGEFGVGLSALMESAVRSAPSMRVARIRGVRAERDLDFAAAHQLCASMLDLLEALPGPQREVLASAFGLSEGRGVDRFRVGLALLMLLSKAAEEQPLLCAIDDTQWLDSASAEALAFVARRLDRQGIALVIAVHEPIVGRAPFAGIDELEVRALPPDASSKLLGSVVAGPLDGSVRDRLLEEAAGNPLALVRLPGQLTPEQLAGLAGLPEMLPVGDRLQERFLAAMADMPAETQTLLLLAATEPDGTANLLWSAAASLGLSAQAGAPAEAAGVLRIGQRVTFRHPLTRLAIYGSATVAERQRIHQALAGALDPAVDPERRAWHRAAASLAPDEDVAAELEVAAARHKGARDDAAAAALLERAAELTPDAIRRYGRTLAAAQAALAAGALGRAAALLDRASPEPLDELQRAQTARLRGVIGLALGRGADRATMLLRAARALEPVDLRLARDSHVEALEVAIYTGRLGSDRGLRETAEAARSAPRPPASQMGVADLLLDGLALLITAGHAAAVPTIRRAIQSLRTADEPRWLPLGALAAVEIWDDEALHDLTSRQVELTGAARARTSVPFLLNQLGDVDAVVTGRFGTTTAPFAEQRELASAIGHRLTAPAITPAELIASAWRGRSTEARDLAEEYMREAFARELGLYVAVAHFAIAVLELGLGRYEAALTAARTVCAESGLFVVTSALPDLIEAAVRAGEREAAVAAVAQLSARAAPSGTDWALGTLARSRALLEDGTQAEALYREAIEHLRRSRAAPQLARAHLVYGEWLRRERRRREAREQLRTARDMFIFMGAQAFAERARVELTATGEHARRPVADDPTELLTAQEAQIARLVSDGATNAAIAAQLFISPRTVEYHLHKTFRKLGVSSRTQLARLMLASDDPNAAS